jgi:CRISPR-associated protein Csm1
MDERTMMVALAALLHDLGKFWQRAGRRGPHSEASAAFVDAFEHLFPYAWRDDIRDGAGNHHRQARKEIEKIVKVADWLGSAERKRGEPNVPQQDPETTPLLPVASRIKLLCDPSYDPQDGDWRFSLGTLSLEREAVFPGLGVQASQADYSDLWERYADELRKLNTIDSPWKLVGFLSLLRKYATFIPSATPWEEDEEYRTLPDISLYDHLKVTAAIAACVNHLFPDHLNELLHGLPRRDPAILDKPVCLMIRGDISGIQKFIYRITKPQVEAKGTAKRLRGRSFYISLLADVIADWFVREEGVSLFVEN